MGIQPSAPGTTDLESTAELPILALSLPSKGEDDPLAATDSWSTLVLPEAPDGVEDADTDVDPDADTAVHLAADGVFNAAAIENRRAELEQNLRKLTDNLRELEQSLERKSAQLTAFEREVGVRDRRISELEVQTQNLSSERQQLQESVTQLRTQLEQSRADTQVARAMAQARDSAANGWLQEREALSRRLQQVEADIIHQRDRAFKYHEVLQSAESRRSLIEVMLGERESALESEQSRMSQLEFQASETSRQSGQREKELQQTLAAERERNDKLEASLKAQRSSFEQQQNDARAADRAAQERIGALQGQLSAQEQALRELQQQKEAASSALAERNALLARVEEQAASSAAVLDNIQHNLEHLGDGQQTRLFVRTQGDTGIVHLLGRRTSVGRTPDNDIHIDADHISRRHAVVLLAGGKTVIEDLNSTNGTYVNGERVTRRTLKEGDIVSLGKTDFRFAIKPPAEQRLTPQP